MNFFYILLFSGLFFINLVIQLYSFSLLSSSISKNSFLSSELLFFTKKVFVKDLPQKIKKNKILLKTNPTPPSTIANFKYFLCLKTSLDDDWIFFDFLNNLS